MRVLIFIFFTAYFLNASELDFFNDDTEVIFQKEKESLFQTRLRLKYENNDRDAAEHKTAILYQNFNSKSLYADYDISTDFDEARFNLKELYYKKALSKRWFLDIGRLNVREGIARGYNATDYFKGAGLVFDSLVASDRRDNRLGTLLIQNTIFFDKSTIKLLYSPEISTKKDTFWSDKEHIGLGLDVTNYTERSSVYADIKLFDNLSSSMILHHNDEGLNLGANLSYALNQWIFYSESSVKKGQKSMTKAVEALSLSHEVKKEFESDEKLIYQGSFGVSFTSENNIVSTMEYIYNSAGMSGNDWEKFFQLGDSNERYAQQLLATRKYHQANEEMISKETIFAQISINDITPEIDINLLSFINPNDKSLLGQIKIQYSNKEDLLFGLSARKMFGDTQSEYGSLDTHTTIMAELEYYF